MHSQTFWQLSLKPSITEHKANFQITCWPLAAQSVKLTGTKSVYSSLLNMRESSLKLQAIFWLYAQFKIISNVQYSGVYLYIPFTNCTEVNSFLFSKYEVHPKL